MKIIIILFLSIFSFKSCLDDSPKYFISMNNAEGIDKGSEIKCKGLNVGQVESIKIVGNKVIAEIALNKEYQPTKGTIAQVDFDNIFGAKNIELIPADNNELLAVGDTIYTTSLSPISAFEDLIKNSHIDSLKKKINMKDFNLDSFPVNLDSLGLNDLIKKAEKLMDLDKILN
ncbi:MAG TPA: MCE family protein [Chitinophagales bacterium]|jgi:ABC-type transporter Mla subunit MlaD|nr:MCE family protein [Chitinophagales bacterium]MBP6154239.1 MCE family protein [Chitinophagales bacterium]HQV78295.1 MCE family protein [Chitinophagales bacterium]HQW79446.1 MCE family protein [Chitinophagales bacterium]HRB67825.1 MCE family protein [Chitinophagales bacterium]